MQSLLFSKEDAETITKFLSDPLLRLNYLYHIIDKSGNRIRFRMNAEQRHLHKNKALRNLILKARQLGFSTYVEMLMLDACLFTPNFHAGIIDRSLRDAKEKLAKVRFAFENLDYLPPNPSPLDTQLATIGACIKQQFQPNPKKPIFSEGGLKLNNGSQILIGTSHRGGTLQLLHISELGSVSVHDPIRAHEIVAGGIPSVGQSCQIFMESTHEGGKYGEHYNQLITAMDNLSRPPEELTPLDFKFHFYAWWRHPNYTMQGTLRQSEAQAKYFAQIEKECNTSISTGQRVWYLAMERTLKSRMTQEFPSTPEEALNPIQAGNIYSLQLDSLRSRGLLKMELEILPFLPIYTSWDIGIGDYTSIWWIQPDGQGRWRILDNYTANALPVEHFVDILRQHDALFGARCAACIVPHDGAKRDPHLHTYDSNLQDAGYSVIRVPRTQQLWPSIDTTREFLSHCLVHARCWQPTVTPAGDTYIAGMDALSNYSSKPMGANGQLSVQPLHDINSHAADALRTFSDARHLGLVNPHPGTPGHNQDTRRSAFVNSYLHRR